MNPDDAMAGLVEKLRQQVAGLPAADREALAHIARRFNEALSATGDHIATQGRMVWDAMSRDPALAAGMAKLQETAASLLDGLDPFTLEELTRYLKGLGSARKEVQ